MYEKKVDLVAWLQNPDKSWDAEDPSSCGARGCFSEKSSYDIHIEEFARNDYFSRKEKIFEETAGRGHGAVLDQAVFTFSIDNLTRASTLFLCGPQYAAHLQQSLRRATAERSFYFDKNSGGTKAKELMDRQFQLYTKMQEEGIPSEDARFILPLSTKTAIQTTLDSRELMHLYSMAEGKGVPDEVKDTVKKMYERASEIAPRLMKDRKTNFEVLSWFPSSQLFSRGENKLFKFKGFERTELADYSNLVISAESIKDAIINRDEAVLSGLKHVHFTFIAPMSIATFHQMTRQRTLDQAVESLTDATFRGQFITPPSINNTKFQENYEKLNNESIKFVQENFENPNALLVLPHSLKVYDVMHVNGWNAIGFIAKRTCTEAQWEIRDIAKDIAKEIYEADPDLGKFAVPQGILYGKCPEKKPCGYCDNKKLEDL
jgi:thymidylate synthase (FAD)